MKPDIYEKITAAIVNQLEQGVRPWARPWSVDHAAGRITQPLRGNGEPYRGINILALWTAAMAQGFSAPIWMTYKQAQELGGQVCKGERGSLVVYANTITRMQEDTTTGEEVEQEIPFMKGYSVFNVEQIDGLPPHFYTPAEKVLDPQQRIEKAEAFFDALGANVRHGGNVASYNVGTDQVRMPPFETFRDPESYYATRAHETIHWTRHPTRLDRDLGRRRWGDPGYALEELVAELGAAFVCTGLEITPEPREDHAAYIASWLKVLNDDKRVIFTAAAHAQRAADFLAARQGSGAASLAA